jgi:hypothetical protein
MHAFVDGLPRLEANSTLEILDTQERLGLKGRFASALQWRVCDGSDRPSRILDVAISDSSQFNKPVSMNAEQRFF